MATRIDTVASRDKLKPRREPYWHRLRRGCYLGLGARLGPQITEELLRAVGDLDYLRALDLLQPVPGKG